MIFALRYTTCQRYNFDLVVRLQHVVRVQLVRVQLVLVQLDVRVQFVARLQLVVLV